MSKEWTDRHSNIVIRVAPVFRAWVNRLAARSRMPVTTLMEMLLVEHAKRIGFTEEAPSRIDRDVKD